MEQNSFLVVQWLPLCSSNAGGSDLIPGMGPTSMKFYFYFCFIDYTKAFDSVGHNKLWKILQEEYQTTWPASWEICMRVKKQQLELDKWNNRLVPNWERSMSSLSIVTLLI